MHDANLGSKFFLIFTIRLIYMFELCFGLNFVIAQLFVGLTVYSWLVTLHMHVKFSEPANTCTVIDNQRRAERG